MYTAYYHLKKPGWSVYDNHLLEHLYLNRFLQLLGEDAANTMGWVNGQSFPEHILFQGMFYHRTIRRQFLVFLKSRPVFSTDEIALAMSQLEAETQSNIDYDPARVALAVNSPPTPHDPIYTNIASPKDFKTIDLIIDYENLTENEQKATLRFDVIINDIILNTARQLAAQYEDGTDIESKNTNDSSSLRSQVTLTVRKETQEETLMALEEALHSFSIKRNWPAIRRHFRAFAREPLWTFSFPFTYYDNTGILTTNSEIAGLATQPILESIKTKIRLSIEHHS